MKQLLLLVSSESRKPADEHDQVVFLLGEVRATELLFAMNITGAQELRMYFSFPGRSQSPPGRQMFETGG